MSTKTVTVLILWTGLLTAVQIAMYSNSPLTNAIVGGLR